MLLVVHHMHLAADSVAAKLQLFEVYQNQTAVSQLCSLLVILNQTLLSWQC